MYSFRSPPLFLPTFRCVLLDCARPAGVASSASFFSSPTREWKACPRGYFCGELFETWGHYQCDGRFCRQDWRIASVLAVRGTDVPRARMTDGRTADRQSDEELMADFCGGADRSGEA